MINKTEKDYLLEFWTHDSSNMIAKVLERPELLQDPYDSVCMKFIAILSYFICLLASAIMLAFIKYEHGHHGNFRTVINQLLSNLYAMVRKKKFRQLLDTFKYIYMQLLKIILLSHLSSYINFNTFIKSIFRAFSMLL